MAWLNLAQIPTDREINTAFHQFEAVRLFTRRDEEFIFVPHGPYEETIYGASFKVLADDRLGKRRPSILRTYDAVLELL